MFTILKGKKNTHPSIHNFQFFVLLSSDSNFGSQTKISFSLSPPHFFLRVGFFGGFHILGGGLLLGGLVVFFFQVSITWCDKPATVFRGSKLPLLHSFGGHVTKGSNLRFRGFFAESSGWNHGVVYFKRKHAHIKNPGRCEGFFLLGVNKGLLTAVYTVDMYIYIYI